MRPFARLALLAGFLTLPFAARAADTAIVSPGLAAPKMAVKTWYKGTPVTSFAPNKIYVVEFWNTGCAPCIDLMPHLSELARNNPDVRFVGVSIWEDDKGGNIKRFVDAMGPKMDYTVGYSGNQGGMAQTWMQAGGQDGIPTAFVVKNGRVEWIGYPTGLDETLKQIKAGSFDLAAFKTQFEKQAAEVRDAIAARPAFAAAKKSFYAGKTTEAETALRAIVARYPSQARAADDLRFRCLAKTDPSAWSAQAKAMVARKDPVQVQRLTDFAVTAMSEPGLRPQAKEAIALALDATDHKDFNTLYYAYDVYETVKDDARELDALDAMLAIYDTSWAKDDKEMRARLLKRKADLESKLAAAKAGAASRGR